jgi:hypothetical protein
VAPLELAESILDRPVLEAMPSTIIPTGTIIIFVVVVIEFDQNKSISVRVNLETARLSGFVGLR